MTRSERVGLIVHPAAGRGEEAIREILPVLLATIKAETIFIVTGTLEAEIAEEMGIRFTPVELPFSCDFSGITSASDAMISRGVDTIVGVGGDGTLCAIANSIIAHGGKARLIGIGAGSSNVGPLVTIRGEDLKKLDLEHLSEQAIHGVVVTVNKAFKGIAFNDVTFSNIFFGTKDGKRVDLDAYAIFDGVRREVEPHSVCGETTKVYKNGRLMIDASVTPIEQIIASPINDPRPYSGKAVSGLLCWGPYLGKDGVLAAANTILIRTHIDTSTLTALEPLCLRQVGFGDGDTVTVTGLKRSAVVIADGNPLCPLAPEDQVTLRLKRSVLRVYKLT